VLPLHVVRAQKVWPPCASSNKEPSKTAVWLPCPGHVQEQKRLPPRIPDESNRGPPREPPRRGVSVACVLVFVMHSCLCLCRLLQRDQHDHTCLFVFVMLARSCLYRLLQHPCRKEVDIDKRDGRSSRSLQGGRQPQHSGAQPAKQGAMPMTTVHMG
jgi:hypothetical protein